MRSQSLFSQIPWFFKLWFGFCLTMGIGMAGFIVWVVIKVMQHSHII